MSTQISMQDRKELEKFTKYLALRAAQVIIQARSGQKVNTACKPDSSAGDWVKEQNICFNLCNLSGNMLFLYIHICMCKKSLFLYH